MYLINDINKFNVEDVVKKQMPLVGNKYSSAGVWLGGQDVAEEGRWVWTSAGNQTLAKDLVWYPSKPLFK